MLLTCHTVRGMGGKTWCTVLTNQGAKYATKATMPQSASLSLPGGMGELRELCVGRFTLLCPMWQPPVQCLIQAFA